MIEPQVQEIDGERYRNLLRKKWRSFNGNLNEKHWEAAKKCLLNQSKYIEDKKFNVISFILEENYYIFLEINTENFTTNEEKVQFLKEVNFLRLIDFQLVDEEPLNLTKYLPTNSNNENKVFLTQVFIVKKSRT